MPEVLFIAAHRPDRSPSQRFRFEQYFDYLKENGWNCELSYLFSEKDDKILYRPGNFFMKSIIFLKSIIKRFRDLSSKNRYDIIFIQREAFMTGSVFFEKRFSNSRAKIIFDFDDAIWNLDISDANKILGFLKNPSKTAKIIELSDLVFAGNKYLAEYAKQYNKNVLVIPTTIDTNHHQVADTGKKGDKICIGWTGSLTTIKHFQFAVPVLEKLKKKYGDRISFKVIGDKNYVNESLGIKGTEWSRETEIRELQTIDIGIMPLPDDEWSKGKCGLKGLQYMSLGIPTIMSPVGVNTDIILQGINGFLASTEQEWLEKLELLIENPQLRERFKKEGQKTVAEKYSKNAWKSVILNTFNNLIQ